MSSPRRPLVSLVEIMFMHTVMVGRYGGGIGVRDAGLVESALNRPLASFEGRLLYDDPCERAAVLWIGLITNNGFVDANKRTATYAMERWLDREGFWLRAEDDAIKEMAVAIANKRCDIKEVAAWLRANAVPREKGPG